MKKLFIYTLALVLAVPAFISCSDDDKKKDIPEEDFKNYPYSSLSPEKQKEKLIVDGKSVIAQLDGLSQAKSIELLLSFQDLVEIDDPQLPNSPAIGKNVIYVNDFNGTYTWNKEAQKWDKTADANKLSFVLPAKRGGTTNNGKIEITGVSAGVNLSGYELPKEAQIVLNADNAVVGTISIKATEVSADKAPKTATIKMNLDNGYTLDLAAEKGSTNVASFQFKKGDVTILGGTADLSGNVDVAELGKGNAEVKILNNLVIWGNVDIENINKEVAILDEAYDSVENYTEAIEKKYEEDWCAIMNKYSDIKLSSREDKTKIASLSYGVKEDVYTYNGLKEDVVFKNYDSVMFLKFNDNTSVEASVYFGTGFDSVLSVWNDFVNKFNK